MFEIWVYSPRVEGVHLRFGKVARGGLRWSDRREDFRTEILGLVKAQTVKNAVIVPTGAKGGFYAKRLPDPAVDRSAWMAEGIESYKTFIRGLLDITDNLVTTPERRNGRAAGRRRPARRRRFLPRGRGRQGHRLASPTSPTDWPPNTASGSATPSLPAARSATTTRPWASPPAARGNRSSATSASWTSTPRPRTSPSSASATCPATCSATACCSPSTSGCWPPSTTGTSSLTRTPDEAASFAERQRLFELPRSSWDDYDKSAHQRRRRRLPPARPSRFPSPRRSGRRSACPTARTELSPPELLRAILLAPADLLYNGGIGTYVKASHGNQRRGRRQGQRRHPGRRPATCGSRWSVKAATWA